jgi:predicted MFS family arabinose efflux permease
MPVAALPLAVDRPVAAESRGHRAGSGPYRRILLGLSAAGVATFAQLYAPQGLLPVLADGLDIGASTAALSVSLTTWGVALAVLPWSVLSDRIGRLRAMRIAISAATVGGLLVAVSPTADALLALRFLEGLALGGLPALAITYLHDEVDPRSTAAAAAAYISGTTVGGASGRLIAGPLAGIVGWRAALAAVAIVCLVAAAIFLRLMPPARTQLRSRPSIGTVIANVRGCLSNPLLLALYAQPMLIMGGFVAVYNYLGFRLEGPSFGLPAVVVSLIFAAYAAGTVSSRLVGRWVPRFGHPVVLAGGTVVTICGVVLTLSSSLVVVVVGLLVLTAGTFVAHATASAWVGQHARVARAQATALYNVALYTGSAVIGWLVGFVWTAAGWSATAAVVIGLALLALLVGYVGQRSRKLSVRAPSVDSLRS